MKLRHALVTLAILCALIPARAQTPVTVVIDGRSYSLTLTPLDPPTGGVGPKPPSALTATRAAASIDLAWTDNSTDETGFAVWRHSGGPSWAKLATLAADTKRFTDWSPPIGAATTYYRVQSVGETGSSPFSNEASVAPVTVSNTPRSLEDMALITGIRPPVALPTTLVRNAKLVPLWEVTGRNFGAKPGRLLINYWPAPFVSWSDTRIVIPEPPRECDITVWAANGSNATSLHRHTDWGL